MNQHSKMVENLLMPFRIKGLDFSTWNFNRPLRRRWLNAEPTQSVSSGFSCGKTTWRPTCRTTRQTAITTKQTYEIPSRTREVFRVLIPSPLFCFPLFSRAPVLTRNVCADQQFRTKPCPLVNFLTTRTGLPAGPLFSYSLVFAFAARTTARRKEMIINKKRKGKQISSDFISAPASPATPLRDGTDKL